MDLDTNMLEAYDIGIFKEDSGAKAARVAMSAAYDISGVCPLRNVR
jgi:hypothetical protein